MDRADWSRPVVESTVPSGERVLVWRPRGVVVDVGDVVLGDTYPVVVAKTSGFFVRWGLTCQEYYSRKRDFYRGALASLAAPVEAWRRDVLSTEFGNHVRAGVVVGVHVRAYDDAYDWPVVPPQPQQREEEGEGGEGGGRGTVASGVEVGAAGEIGGGGGGGGDGSGGSSSASISAAGAQTFEAVAPLGLFVESMQHILQRRPDTHFFVASNSPAVKQQLFGLFPGRVTSVSNEGGYAERGTVEGVQRAVVDWALLTDAKLLVHSFGSSFAEEAAGATLAPSVRMRAGGHVYGVDLEFPTCNNALLEHQYRVTGRRRAALEAGYRFEVDDQGCYKDASFKHGEDVRCGSVATRRPCEKFHDSGWGVPGVYC